MKRFVVFAAAIVAAALVAGTAGALRSHPHSTNVGSAGMPTMQELQANVDKLPAEDFEDRSLENPRETRRSAPLQSDPFVSLTGP